jgi:hypothetical protein
VKYQRRQKKQNTPQVKNQAAAKIEAKNLAKYQRVQAKYAAG